MRTASDPRHERALGPGGRIQQLRRRRSACRPAQLTVIALGEYLYGIARSRHRARYQALLAKLLDVCPLLEVDHVTAGRYAATRQVLRERGRPIPSNDAWIAALALQHSLPLLSRDTHFDEVPGVRRVGW